VLAFDSGAEFYFGIHARGRLVPLSNKVKRSTTYRRSWLCVWEDFREGFTIIF
jgi:hypothetical protein